MRDAAEIQSSRPTTSHSCTKEFGTLQTLSDAFLILPFLLLPFSAPESASRRLTAPKTSGRIGGMCACEHYVMLVLFD